jgi:hypothetical protein
LARALAKPKASDGSWQIPSRLVYASCGLSPERPSQIPWLGNGSV